MTRTMTKATHVTVLVRLQPLNLNRRQAHTDVETASPSGLLWATMNGLLKNRRQLTAAAMRMNSSAGCRMGTAMP